jgi:hypothetical protein
MVVCFWPCLGQPATNRIFSAPYYLDTCPLFGAIIYFHIITESKNFEREKNY